MPYNKAKILSYRFTTHPDRVVRESCFGICNESSWLSLSNALCSMGRDVSADIVIPDIRFTLVHLLLDAEKESGDSRKQTHEFAL